MQAKDRLQKVIDDFYREKIVLAGTAICKTSESKIKDGDVIMVYAWSVFCCSYLCITCCTVREVCFYAFLKFFSSSLIIKVLSHSRERGIDFKVVVVDARPKFEGQCQWLTKRLLRPCIKVRVIVKCLVFVEGREMLRRLVKANIKCSYVSINAASYVMREVRNFLYNLY